ncbi:hypothetical protein GCM10009007_20300 [Formosimonas limnophila]|uniref:Uncharacterized protein n=1 Tax=Formosimonas limnophila TaxID=1384487 RepID=A0A8J3CM11_9BURK|nr:hypothetical protein [Formosimonas limnophila]GHA79196.1 hypothetical protein GCM10009007_20300 [Formosimonas limnophila]
MNIKHTDDGFKGKFFVEQDHRELAEMTYVWVGNENSSLTTPKYPMNSEAKAQTSNSSQPPFHSLAKKA